MTLPPGALSLPSSCLRLLVAENMVKCLKSFEIGNPGGVNTHCGSCTSEILRVVIKF